MAVEKLEKIIKQIKAQPKAFYLEDVIAAHVQYADVDTALLAATMCARVDIIHCLVDGFHADLYKTYTIPSQRHAAQNSQVNLLEAALCAYLTRDDADKSAEGQSNLLETVKYFLAKRVPVLPNEDPLEGPFTWAHFLANPDLATNTHPYYYLVPQCVNQEPPEKFSAIYEQMKWVRPVDADDFEQALAQDVQALKLQMNTAANNFEPTGNNFRRIGEIFPPAPTPKPENK